MKTKFILFTFTFLLGLAVQAAPKPIEFERITVEMGAKQYELEFAKTMPQRARGLMFRDSMCKDCGMLFAFDVKRIGSIWMKNTKIPLDLAYVDADGVIVDIFQLRPYDLTPVRSSKPVSFAIEMNQNWFASKNIKVGDRINIALQNALDGK